MSQPAVRNMPVIVSHKGIGKDSSTETRSTGSPLLDSLVLTQKTSSKAYLPQSITPRPARQSTSNIQTGLALQSLLVAERAVASKQSKQSAPTKPIKIPSATGKPNAEPRSQPLDQPSSKPSAKPQSTTAQPVSTATNSLHAPSPSPSIPKHPRPGKRLPNPSLERAAAVGMLDLSDKLLFGGEDDTLTSTYLGDKDPLTEGGDEAIVLKYLSQQIAESKLSKFKGRLPLAVRPQPETEPSQAVLDARNFKVVQAALNSKDLPVDVKRKQPESQPESIAAQPLESTVDVAAMGQQIAHLNRQVERLTQELLKIASKDPLSEAGEVA